MLTNCIYICCVCSRELIRQSTARFSVNNTYLEENVPIFWYRCGGSLLFVFFFIIDINIININIKRRNHRLIEIIRFKYCTCT